MARLSMLCGPNTAQLVQMVFRYCMESYANDAPTQVCNLLNLVFGQASRSKASEGEIEDDSGSLMKRRRLSTETRVQKFDSTLQYSEELGSAALEWCRFIASEGRFDIFTRCHAWTGLQPAPIALVVNVEPSDLSVPEVSIAVQRWVENVSFLRQLRGFDISFKGPGASLQLVRRFDPKAGL